MLEVMVGGSFYIYDTATLARQEGRRLGRTLCTFLVGVRKEWVVRYVVASICIVVFWRFGKSMVVKLVCESKSASLNN